MGRGVGEGAGEKRKATRNSRGFVNNLTLSPFLLPFFSCSTKVVDMGAILNEALAVSSLLTYLKGKGDTNMISYTKLWVQISAYITSLSRDTKPYELEAKAGVIKMEIKKLVDEGVLRLPKGLEDPIRHKLGSSVAEAVQVSRDLMNYLADNLHTKIQKGFLKSKGT